MPPDVKTKRTKEWMELAKSDLASGRHQLTAVEPFTRQAGFQAPQSAEKALKGFLVWHQLRFFSKQHDLRYLGDLALQKDQSLKAAVDDAASLHPYAVTIRYPGYSDADPSVKEAEEALGIAERLFNEVLARLPMDAQP